MKFLERSSFFPVLKNCSVSKRKAPAGRYLNEVSWTNGTRCARTVLRFYIPALSVVVHCISHRMCIPFCSSVDSWAWNASATIGGVHPQKWWWWWITAWVEIRLHSAGGWSLCEHCCCGMCLWKSQGPADLCHRQWVALQALHPHPHQQQ